ncbi:GntR family transcriptional regulator [Micromonospora gifhornensis]|uniref:GntR family transcriptional regulator n=2 Tax=Micromonospora gifhornensis TaxID=84594 RepID=A0ABQ4I6E6_9ACTN|nr:GntR family transcriptional regulator [Micromonospora gifhornensis]GIJ13452.1 GntR family transcriptional regulator [Micromonospora gifhornensis]
MERSGAAGVMDDGRPIFLQIAELLESSILDGTLAEESQVPSTNELAAFHRINPATAAKGVNKLVDDGTLYKKRGIGMFVSSGARAKLRARRRDEFARQYVQPLVAEARKLGIDPAELKHMIDNWEETR